MKNLLIFVCILCSSMTPREYHNEDLIKVIITGHTCGGKTSLINELERRGYFIVPEVATAVLFEEHAKLDLAHPESAPHTLPSQINDLQFKIFAAQNKAYKKAIMDCSLTLPKDNLIIFDRAEYDTYVYTQVFYSPGTFSDEELAQFNQIIANISSPNHFCHDVIFCQIVPQEYFNGKESNVTRHESYEQAQFIGDKIEQAYEQDFGLTLHKIGFKDTIAQKADEAEEILKSIISSKH